MRSHDARKLPHVNKSFQYACKHVTELCNSSKRKALQKNKCDQSKSSNTSLAIIWQMCYLLRFISEMIFQVQRKVLLNWLVVSLFSNTWLWKVEFSENDKSSPILDKSIIWTQILQILTPFFPVEVWNRYNFYLLICPSVHKILILYSTVVMYAASDRESD